MIENTRTDTQIITHWNNFSYRSVTSRPTSFTYTDRAINIHTWRTLQSWTLRFNERHVFPGYTASLTAGQSPFPSLLPKLSPFISGHLLAASRDRSVTHTPPSMTTVMTMASPGTPIRSSRLVTMATARKSANCMSKLLLVTFYAHHTVWKGRLRGSIIPVH